MENRQHTQTNQSPAGWYEDPERVKTLRYWDGGDWTEDFAPAPMATGNGHRETSLAGLVIIGVVLEVVGGMLAMDGWTGDSARAIFGLGIANVGFLFILTAVIAWGVKLGIRAAHE